MPVWEMSADQLAQAAQALEGQRPRHMEVLTWVFGRRDGAKFAHLVEEESPSAIKAARKMHETLPPDKRAIIDDVLHQGGTVAASELRTLEGKLREVQRAHSPEDLLNDTLKYAITELGNQPRPHTMSLQQLGALMQLNAGYQLAIDKKWDVTEISRATVFAAGRRFPGAEAESVLGRFLESRVPILPDFATLLSKSVEEWKRQKGLQTATAAPRRDLGHDDGHST